MENDTDSNTTTCQDSLRLYLCGVIMEIIGSVGIVWSMLVLFVLWRQGHIKSNVTYIPICSLLIATCGQLFLVVLHVAPSMLDQPLSGINQNFSNFMFFPFWYAVLSSVWLMAAHRWAVAFSVSSARKFFTRRVMTAASLFVWTLGVVIGGAAYGEGVLENWHDGDSDTGMANCSAREVNGRHHAFSWLFHSRRSAVLTTTQTFDCLTLVIVAVCYAFVIYRLKYRGVEIAAQLNGQHQIAPISGPAPSRRLSATSPCHPQNPKPAVSRVSSAQKVRHPASTSAAISDTSPGAAAGVPNVDLATLWFVTLQFGLLSLSVGLFAIFILLGNVRHSSELLLAMEILYPTTSLLNILLVSMTSKKLQSELVKTLTAPWHWLTRSISDIQQKYREQQQKQQLKPPPIVVISRAENTY